MREVVITGMGCLTSVGFDVQSTWDAISHGVSGIAPITGWDVSDWVYPLAGEIKNYDAKNLISDRKLLKFISKQDVLGLNAASQAIADSGLIAFRDARCDAEAFNYRTGVYVGSPGNKFEQQNDFLPLLKTANGDLKQFADQLFETVHPMWLLRILPNNVLAYVGITHGFKGPNHNVTNHVVSGLQAILEAHYAIAYGQIDQAVVVSYDHAVEAQSIAHYGNAGLISKRGLNAFDTHHDGTIIGEGAGALVLETKEAAIARGAPIYASILSGATTSDAQGIFSIDREANGLASAMQQTLERAHVSHHALGMMCLHGNGVPLSDETEARAIKTIAAENTPATGFKWSLGHTLAGAGVIETIMTSLSLLEGRVPGIANLTQKSQACAHIQVSCDHQEIRGDTAMVVSRAFSGLNTCLLLGKVHG